MLPENLKIYTANSWIHKTTRDRDGYVDSDSCAHYLDIYPSSLNSNMELARARLCVMSVCACACACAAAAARHVRVCNLKHDRICAREAARLMHARVKAVVASVRGFLISNSNFNYINGFVMASVSSLRT